MTKIHIHIHIRIRIQGLSRSLSSKESSCNAGDAGLIPGLGRSPGGGHGYALQVSCLENPMSRSLVGYSPQGHKELGMTEVTERALMHTYLVAELRSLSSAMLRKALKVSYSNSLFSSWEVRELE